MNNFNGEKKGITCPQKSKILLNPHVVNKCGQRYREFYERKWRKLESLGIDYGFLPPPPPPTTYFCPRLTTQL